MTADYVTVLECKPGQRLAKQIEADCTVSDYDAGWLFRPTQVPITTLDELAALLRVLADDPTCCIVRGRLREGACAEWVPRRSAEKPGRDDPDFESEPTGHRWFAIDLDVSPVMVDHTNPQAAIEEWRAGLPECLREAGMIFQLSAKAGLVPYLRGHAWFLATTPATDAQLKAWVLAQGFDDSACLAQAVQVHYTANPVLADGATDVLVGKRVFSFDGPEAAIAWPDPRAVVERAVPRSEGPAVPASAGVLAVLGDANDHAGRRWFLCGALGGVWRRKGWTREEAASTIRDWLDTVDGCDVEAGVVRCLGAWDLPLGEASGGGALVDLLGEAWAARVAEASGGMLKSTLEAKIEAFVPAGLASALAGDLDAPMSLSGANGQMWHRTEDGYAGPYAHKRMRSLARALGTFELICRDGEGKLLPYDRLYDNGSHVEKVVRDFADARTWYDRETAELHQGYSLPAIEAVRDAGVEAWLEALAGGLLPNLLTWIRACAQDCIARPAAALVLVGPPGIGKTLIFRALARLWGARSFVPLADSIAQFNGTITRCPIVLDDECQALKARKVTSAEFRSRVQAHERDFELKGKEKVELIGCTREGLTANDLSEVTLADVRGAGVVDALRDRLLVVEAPGAAREALAVVRGAGDAEAELTRIVGHLAWVWASVEAPALEAGRFIAAGGDGAEAVALAGVARTGADLWESFARWCDDAQANAGGGWVRVEGAVYANAQALAAVLGMRGGGQAWDVVRVVDTLRAVTTGPSVRLRLENRTRVRYWPIDESRARAIAGV